MVPEEQDLGVVHIGARGYTGDMEVVALGEAALQRTAQGRERWLRLIDEDVNAEKSTVTILGGDMAPPVRQLGSPTLLGP